MPTIGNTDLSETVLKEPIIMGHETSAEVVAIGAGVDDFKVGDRVCCEPAVPCRGVTAGNSVVVTGAGPIGLK